jgi:hypothetical protein
MELVRAHQVPFEELLNETIDVLIAACGYDSRSMHLVQSGKISAKRKIALLFREKENISNSNNENIFKENGFECYELDNGDSAEVITILDSLCKDCKCENIKLVVDYSSMSKMWYGTIINYFALNDLEYNNLEVFFCYTPEYFVPPAARKTKLPKPEPVCVNKSSITEDKPLALIIGLGYDESKAEFLCDFFKPDDVYFFLPNPGFDDKYTMMARTNNRNILVNVKSSHLIQYPAKEIEEIDSRLTELCLRLRLNYRVIFISLGPQTFSLAGFLLNVRYPDIEIWNLSSMDQSIDLKPAGTPIVLKALLTSEEE